jgi:hypothetical protein
MFSKEEQEKIMRKVVREKFDTRGKTKDELAQEILDETIKAIRIALEMNGRTITAVTEHKLRNSKELREKIKQRLDDASSD